MIEIAAKTLAIDRVAPAEAEQCHRDVLAARDRPCSPCAQVIRLTPGIAAVVSENIRSGGLAGDEGFRTEDVGDKAGGDFGNVAGARG